jgi:methylase of polypeptide subunit release factors
MDAAQILGYLESPNFLRAAEDFPGSQELGYVLRKAREECGLIGVYVLKNPAYPASPIPVVYFCQASSAAQAKEIHKRVWNQGIVPFVLVQTPQYLRLYSGFFYQQPTAHETEDRGILKAAVAFNEVLEQLAAFRAEAIDHGALWQEWGDSITPESRVDWSLLKNLEKLDAYLQQHNVSREISHALIGKFVYFRYLKDRHIISEKKLARWGIAPQTVFSRHATLEGFISLDRHTHDWLNGAIFPLDPGVLSSVPSLFLQQVAGVFSGDTPEGQLHLDFAPYDFSFIPIETISVIYEQFLHQSEAGQTTVRGRESGAYYTPIPLITFILEELEKKRPLTQGMKILDPACGSGAFLVQCYRRLIEKQRRQTQQPLRPDVLRDILTSQIFGVERDGDACRVAELSLILTLLDYVDPPDLENNPSFQLPRLRDTNIFEADFFAPDSTWIQVASTKKFDWIIGNPPWVSLRSQSIREEDSYIWQWMKTHAGEAPTGGNQVAEAFVWKTLPCLAQDGVSGLVLPAMTLFKKESIRFRQRFFEMVCTWCVANFANLAYVLFAGRATRPALVLFFQPRHDRFERDPDETILTYSPLVMNQEANRPRRASKQKDTWHITINAAEMQEVPTYKAATGDMLPWKLAMWGCFRDGKLLERVARKFSALQEFAVLHGFEAHEGFQLRALSAKAQEPLEARPELVGKKCIDYNKLRKSERIFVFPDSVMNTIPEKLTYVRKGRGELPLRVSMPPHILVDAGRRFAVYSEEFIAVPARQIGIASPSGKASLLKALSLYLSSDFVTYQQFFTTPEWGISTSRATLEALKNLPIPLDSLSQKELNEWADLRDSLAEIAVQEQQRFADKIVELNERVYSLLGLREADRILVHDFVTMTMQCIQGKVTGEVLVPPSETTMRSYLQRLQRELDAFIDGQPDIRHEIIAVHDSRSAMLAIRLTQGKTSPASIIRPANQETALEFAQIRERLRQQHSQWLYFNRNLRIYDREVLYCFKPMQALHWTQRQAILDAGEVIAETLAVEA